MTTLAAHLRAAVEPELPPELIDAACFGRIQAVAGRLPAALSEFFGFECRLGEAAARADFLVCAKAEFSGRDVLAGRLPDATLGADLRTDAAWGRVLDFAAAWAEPASPLHASVENVWLEFDVAEARVGSPSPSAFFGAELRGGARRQASLRVLDEALGHLLGSARASALGPGLDAVLRALPEQAWVFQVGAMLARPTDAVRLCVRGLRADSLPAFLDAVRWPGDAADARAVIDDSFARAASVDLDLDLAPAGTLPKLGFECSFAEREPRERTLAPFLDSLLERGLCTDGKRAGLLAWTRGFHERSHPERWPDDLRQAARQRGAGALCVFLRWPYHVKLVHEPERPLAAKAYLAVRQVWPDRETLRRMAGRAPEPATTLSTE